MNKDVLKAENLTRNQSLVMDALGKADAPLSAYGILDVLRDHGFRAPPQVYRALDKLVERGLVHRLESINAFIACRHPSCSVAGDENTAFAICKDCDRVTELVREDLFEKIGQIAGEMKFSLSKSVIELRGICSDCQNQQDPSRR